MITVNHLSKSYETNIVLNNISLNLPQGMRAGLVGTNGAGKSTLLKILAGLESTDSGSISFSSSTVAGYLPQNMPYLSGQTLDELLLKSVGDIRQMEARLRQIERVMTAAEGNRLADLLSEYGELAAKFEESGGYEIDHRIESILAGLGIGYLDRSRHIDTLSGGEKTRLSLAALLLKTPGLLLLDEPTNNLDEQSLTWLETYLSSYKGALLAASHDRRFLNNIVTEIFEIDEHSHQLIKYTGNYDDYKLAKEAERQKWEEDYRNQQEEISELKKRLKSGVSALHRTVHQGKARDNDKFIPYFKGQRLQNSTSRSIRDAEERLKRIMENPVLKPPRRLQFKADFKSINIRSAEVLTAYGLSKKFGTRLILRNVNLSLRHDSRTLILGPNGAGKTTLLRILVGVDSADQGRVTYAPGVRLGYLSQEPEIGDKEETLLACYSRNLTGVKEDYIFGLVTCGLFSYADINKQVGQLSLGQLRKLQIARLIAAEPNVLVLDEPTNHLSLDTLEMFESAIAAFRGPVIAVSHDRQFIRQFGGTVWELKEGELVNQSRAATIEYTSLQLLN